MEWLGRRYFILSILAVLLRVNAGTNVSDCPSSCSCERGVSCPEEFSAMSRDYPPTCTIARCIHLSEDAAALLPSGLNYLSVMNNVKEKTLIRMLLNLFTNLRALSLKLANDTLLPLDTDAAQYPNSISFLNLSNGNLSKFPDVSRNLPHLRTLNVSGNMIVTADLNLTLTRLELLDLSQNKLTELSLRGFLPNLKKVLLGGNRLGAMPKMNGVPLLKVLDLSYNLLSFDNLHEEVTFKEDNQACPVVLPSSITSLLLRGNAIRRLPVNGCGLLAGLSSLEHLDLRNNFLEFISYNFFSSRVLKTLMSLKLDNNLINYLNPNAFDNFDKLEFLSLTSNRLQAVPLQVIKKFSHLGFSSNDSHSPTLIVRNNPFSCDCLQRRVWHFLVNSQVLALSPDDMICSHPPELFGTKLTDLAKDDLQCYDVAVLKASNSSCKEYLNCEVQCIFNGLPRPKVHWISPAGKVISAQSIAKDTSLSEDYALSEDGHQLTIYTLQLPKTGVYRCIANNTLSSAEAAVQVGVVLAPVGSIVAISVSAVSFTLAIVLNSVNLCHYYCQHLRWKRARREMEAMSLKLETPNKSKQKRSPEPPPSSNANEYYKKYDFTCQQVFLDTLIKGAHTVKRTLHDAKNSEFSNNVWEYAVHLRDRLHIDFPTSVQFPRVSMPSISMPSINMPSISMPSMPTFQSINTNIERLGTSVMSRSHNLAMTVGSVFTLRWLRPGNSDNESDSDVETASVSQVEAQVHKHDCPDPPKPTGSPETQPDAAKPRKVRYKRKSPRESPPSTSKSEGVHFAVDTDLIRQDEPTDSVSQLSSSVLVVVDEKGENLSRLSNSADSDTLELFQFETNV